MDLRTDISVAPSGVSVELRTPENGDWPLFLTQNGADGHVGDVAIAQRLVQNLCLLVPLDMQIERIRGQKAAERERDPRLAGSGCTHGQNRALDRQRVVERVAARKEGRGMAVIAHAQNGRI